MRGGDHTHPRRVHEAEAAEVEDEQVGAVGLRTRQRVGHLSGHLQVEIALDAHEGAASLASRLDVDWSTGAPTVFGLGGSRSIAAVRLRRCSVPPMDMKLELVAVPVSDVDRAKGFYTDNAGFNADHDHRISDEIRFVQLTLRDPHARSRLGTGVTDAAPGSMQGLQLVVEDIEAARAEPPSAASR